MILLKCNYFILEGLLYNWLILWKLWQALEEVEKNFVSLRCMLCGDGEVEPNTDQVSQLALEVCKEDVLALMIHKLPNLEWEVSAAATSFLPFTRACIQYFSLRGLWLFFYWNVGKKGFSPLLVHIVEANGWLKILLCTIHREPLWTSRLSCCMVSI